MPLCNLPAANQEKSGGDAVIRSRSGTVVDGVIGAATADVAFRPCARHVFDKSHNLEGRALEAEQMKSTDLDMHSFPERYLPSIALIGLSYARFQHWSFSKGCIRCNRTERLVVVAIT